MVSLMKEFFELVCLDIPRDNRFSTLYAPKYAPKLTPTWGLLLLTIMEFLRIHDLGIDTLRNDVVRSATRITLQTQPGKMEPYQSWAWQ